MKMDWPLSLPFADFLCPKFEVAILGQHHTPLEHQSTLCQMSSGSVNGICMSAHQFHCHRGRYKKKPLPEACPTYLERCSVSMELWFQFMELVYKPIEAECGVQDMMEALYVC
jgi:hypothetical protein